MRRKIQFINDKYYHIYNRGVDKRIIFQDIDDLVRFFQSMQEFNTVEPIGSIYENRFRKIKLGHPVSKREKLIDFICYCLNPNHYHFVLQQLTNRGIEKFMHRVGMGYAKYFNQKYKRGGSLFQGRYRAIHIDSNEYLLHLSTYVNLNDRVHDLSKFGHPVSKYRKSSWQEYLGEQKGICRKDIILDQFENVGEYKKFAENSLKNIRERKEIEKLLLE